MLWENLAGAGEFGEAIGKSLVHHSLDLDPGWRSEAGNALQTVGHERLGGLEAIAEGFVFFAHRGVGRANRMNLANRESSLGFLLNDAMNVFGAHIECGPFLI